MRHILIKLFQIFSVAFFIACSDPQTNSEISNKETIVRNYQTKIEQVKNRLDSLKENDKNMQAEIDSLDMRR